MANSRQSPARQGSQQAVTPYEQNVSTAPRRKKLSIAECFGPQEPLREGDPIKWLGDFFCHVTKSKNEQSDLGPYIRWYGDFRAVLIETGEIVQAATAIFPSIASEWIEAAVAGGSNDAGGATQNVFLAFRVGIEPARRRAGRTSLAPYQYILKDIQPPNYKSPLDLFMADAAMMQLEHKPDGEMPHEPDREAAD